MTENSLDAQNIPVLYSFRRCPYAMRARLALAYAGVRLELREIVLRDKPDHMCEISPKATVPVLQLPGGKVIDESLDIMHHALTQNDPDGWADNYDAALIRANDTDFKNALDRYKYPNRYPNEDCSGARDRCEAFFKELNDHLSTHKYLCADHITLPDMAIFPFIRQCANVDRVWFDSLPYTALHCWLKDRLESEIFAAIMAKYKPWQAGDPPLHWPE